MNRIDLSESDVFRLNCEGCNANEIAAAMMIPKGAAIAMIARSRLSYAQGQESRKAKTLGLTNRSIHEDDRSMSGVDAVC